MRRDKLGRALAEHAERRRRRLQGEEALGRWVRQGERRWEVLWVLVSTAALLLAGAPRLFAAQVRHGWTDGFLLLVCTAVLAMGGGLAVWWTRPPGR